MNSNPSSLRIEGSNLREKELREYYRGRGFGEDDAESAVAAVREFEGHLRARGASLESVDVDDVKGYVSLLISEGRNSMDRLLAIARYCYVAKKDDAYIYFTQIIGGRTVLPSISERLAQIAGEEKRDVVFEGVEAPPLGAPPEQFPRVTGLLMERLESELDQETRRKVLAGNHHRVPVESFAKHKEWYREAESLDQYLKKVHDEAVAELERYLEEGKIWYEQELTPDSRVCQGQPGGAVWGQERRQDLHDKVPLRPRGLPEGDGPPDEEVLHVPLPPGPGVHPDGRARGLPRVVLLQRGLRQAEVRRCLRGGDRGGGPGDRPRRGPSVPLLSQDTRRRSQVDASKPFECTCGSSQLLSSYDKLT